MSAGCEVTEERTFACRLPSFGMAAPHPSAAAVSSPATAVAAAPEATSRVALLPEAPRHMLAQSVGRYLDAPSQRGGDFLRVLESIAEDPVIMDRARLHVGRIMALRDAENGDDDSSREPLRQRDIIGEAQPALEQWCADIFSVFEVILGRSAALLLYILALPGQDDAAKANARCAEAASPATMYPILAVFLCVAYLYDEVHPAAAAATKTAAASAASLAPAYVGDAVSVDVEGPTAYLQLACQLVSQVLM